MSEQMAALAVRVDALEKDIHDMAQDVKAIRSKTDRWSGIVGLITLAIPAVLGGVVGWFAAK